MKNTINLLKLIVLLLLLQSNLYGQKASNKILRTTNIKALKEMSQTLKAKAIEEKRVAIEKANQMGWPIQQTLENGTFMELMRLDEKGNPVYYSTKNVESAKTISTNKVHTGGGLGLNLEGNGMTIGEWDGGLTRVTHEQLTGRVTQKDAATTLSNHGTHVAGTMVADGTGNAIAKGMAPQALLHCYDWNSDEAEIATFATTVGTGSGLVSNHSYGASIGWEPRQGGGSKWHGDPTVSTFEPIEAGLYDNTAVNIDKIAYNAPYLLMCWAAGNDRNNTYDPSYSSFDNGTSIIPVSQITATNYPPDCNGGTGYDCILPTSTAKNVMTVGAVEDITNGYASVSDVIRAQFSSGGPSDDGRIKPDITANGVDVTSTIETADNAYDLSSGTSMATPAVTGSLMLLQEHYQNTKGTGNFMRASTLKALAIHTADEAGTAPGPDYQFGWGLMNTATAAQVITASGNTGDFIYEKNLSNGQPYTQTVTATGTEPLIITIVWTDPAGTAKTGLDDHASNLVNDLDVRVSQGGTTYMPYVMPYTSTFSDNDLGAAAQTGDNTIDNVEKIVIASPTAGATYTITVNHKGTLASTQVFSMIVTGNAPSTCNVVDNIATSNITSTSATITWNAVSGVSSYDWEISVAGTTPGANPYQSGTINGTTLNLTGISNLNQYDIYIKSNCTGSGGNFFQASTKLELDCSIISDFPYTINFDDFTQPNYTGGANFTYCQNGHTLSQCWENKADDDTEWLPRSGRTPTGETYAISGTNERWTGPQNGDHTSGSGQYLYIESEGCSNKTANVISPRFDLTNVTNTELKFWYVMNGTNNQMGTLNVDVSTDQGSTWTTKWTKSGDQGTAWQEATIDLSSYDGNMIDVRFNGILSADPSLDASDIAIDDISVNGTVAPVPVELASFEGQATTEGALLNWVTVSEIINRGFEIQRSLNTVDFETIGFVEGHGTTFERQTYEYIDRTVNQTSSYYYRLKQIDEDGTYEYSDIVHIRFGESTLIDALKVFPNPTKNKLNIVLSETLNDEYFIEMYNIVGVKVLSKTFSTNTEILDVSNLARGVYIVKVTSNNEQVIAINKIILE